MILQVRDQRCQPRKQFSQRLRMILKLDAKKHFGFWPPELNGYPSDQLPAIACASV
jgi:hypothetical protein